MSDADSSQQHSTPTNCRLCNSGRARLLFVKRGLPRFLCEDCGLIHTHPAEGNPNMKPLDEFDDAYLQWFGPHAADAANLNARSRWLGRFAKLSGARILDIGCGSGKWVRHLRGLGAEAAGVEPFDDLFRRFLADEDFFTHGDAADLRRAGKQYDIVTAFDVIEHVERPGEFLDDLAALVADGGVAALCTPDSSSLHAKLAGKLWHCQNLFHISVFNRKTLINAAKARGLELLHFSRRGRRHSCGYIIRYFFEHYLGGRKPPEWVTRLDNLCVTLNLMDEMYLCFRKTDGGEKARAPARV